MSSVSIWPGTCSSRSSCSTAAGKSGSVTQLGPMLTETGTTQPSAVATSAQNGQLLSIIGAIQIGAQAAQQNISELLIILVSINLSTR